jgi:hypothetical protein
LDNSNPHLVIYLITSAQPAAGLLAIMTTWLARSQIGTF